MENDDCPICLDKLSTNNCNPDGCKHKFCYGCLIEWTLEHKTCPMCRTEYTNIIRPNSGSKGKIWLRSPSTLFTPGMRPFEHLPHLIIH